MKHIKVTLLFSLLLTPFLSGCQIKADEYVNPDQMVNVVLHTDEHMRVIGDECVSVKKNSNVHFKLSFDDGYYFGKTDIGEFNHSTNYLVIKNVQKPLDVNATSRTAGQYQINVVNDPSLGKVEISPNLGGYDLGNEVTIKVTPLNNNTFLCYSYEKAYRGGYAELTGSAICFDSEYTFEVTNDLTLVTNYYSPKAKYYIDYDLNGGQTIMGNDIIHTDFVPYYYNAERPLFPVTINGNYFFRDGYTLTSFNTEPDGSGEFIGVGSKICVDYFKDSHVTLYCQWHKWTDASLFEYDIDEVGDLTLTSFNNSSNIESLVIPNEIDGHLVKTISEDFCNNESSIKEIILNRDLDVISKNAFHSLDNIEKLYFHTSMLEIHDESFNSNSLKTIVVIKNTSAKDWGNCGWLNMNNKWDTLYTLSKDERPKVIMVGHSTILYNHDLTPFKEKWGNNYIFYKYCGTAGIDTSLILYTLLPLLTEKDYLFIPWYHSTVSFGTNTMRNFGYLQYDMDCFMDVDYQVIKQFFFESFTLYREYIEKSIYSIVLPSEFASTTSPGDEFGGGKAGENCDDPNNSNGTYDWNISSYLNMERYMYVRDYLEKTPFDNPHTLITWNSYNRNNVRTEESHQSFLDFETMIRTNFDDCTFFDTMEENILPGDHFIPNDMMHLSPRGGDIRIARWLTELPL